MARWWNERPHLPQRGDLLEFKSRAHGIYDDFPDGNIVRPQEVFVDFTEHIVVYCHRRYSLDRWSYKKQKWVVSNYVAVQFKSMCGRWVWTNFSRDGEQWLWTRDEMRAWLGQT